jgi:hypothetical protein
MFSITRLGGAGLARRTFLQIGLLGPLGLPLRAAGAPAGAAPSPPANRAFGRAKRCILVYLNGGPSQLDTWDMKPDAPAEVRGELRPIATSVPGIQTSELYPLIATQVDKLKIVRSVTHNAPVHTTAVYTMLTGTYHRTPAVDQTRIEPQDHPHLGSIYAHAAGWRDHTPPFVCLPTLFRAPPVEGVWAGQTAGFLGRRYDPLVIEGDKTTARFRLPEVELPPTLDAERLAGRRALLAELDRAAATLERTGRTAEKNAVFEQAWSLLDSPTLRRAVQLDREPAAVRERYGAHLFGQGLLLARRLAEAGVPMVTVYWIDPTPAGDGGGEYDSHGRIYWHMRNRLAGPTDRGLSALLIDLWQRGLAKDTLLVVMSEFGRTPKLNKDAGRDHWPDAQSILLGGAGISGGTLHGATDKHAAYPIADPVTPPDLGQTILHLLGVPPDLELRDPQGRPIRASAGEVNDKLVS